MQYLVFFLCFLLNLYPPLSRYRKEYFDGYRILPPDLYILIFAGERRFSTDGQFINLYVVVLNSNTNIVSLRLIDSERWTLKRHLGLDMNKTLLILILIGFNFL